MNGPVLRALEAYTKLTPSQILVLSLICHMHVAKVACQLFFAAVRHLEPQWMLGYWDELKSPHGYISAELYGIFIRIHPTNYNREERNQQLFLTVVGF